MTDLCGCGKLGTYSETFNIPLCDACYEAALHTCNPGRLTSDGKGVCVECGKVVEATQ